ncbi:MAG TPA: type II toxin-antitoxin system RelE/ParE family toxin [Candidatus Nanoarchaeia archaeon]|nr:type II toxin-antitoxin system RelE/ParE family toxin [Candidatus Nanoarchaeia archaeon]
MLEIEYSPDFLSLLRKIKNNADKEKVKKQIKKIIEDPEIGKPMRYARKGTREVYLGSFRLSYALVDNKLIFLDLYHKDEQ